MNDYVRRIKRKKGVEGEVSRKKLEVMYSNLFGKRGKLHKRNSGA